MRERRGAAALFTRGADLVAAAGGRAVLLLDRGVVVLDGDEHEELHRAAGRSAPRRGRSPERVGGAARDAPSLGCASCGGDGAAWGVGGMTCLTFQLNMLETSWVRSMEMSPSSKLSKLLAHCGATITRGLARHASCHASDAAEQTVCTAQRYSTAWHNRRAPCMPHGG